MSKTSTLCSANVLRKEDSKSTNFVLEGAKKSYFFTSNAINLQSMWSNVLKNLHKSLYSKGSFVLSSSNN
jgi:hypothetical protein